MKYLYKITYTRAAYPYNKEKYSETVEMFLDESESVNTGRLGGFQRDSITVLKKEKIRPRHAIEINADIERNEISFSIDVDEHITQTLEPWEKEQEFVNAAESYDENIEEYLVKSGFYKEVAHDNSYNYCSDFSDDIDFKVFVPVKDSSDDWYYNENAIVSISKHYGLDARCGYSHIGIFQCRHYDGLSHFLQMHVELFVTDLRGDEIDYYDGDSPYYHVERDGYALKSVDAESQDIKLEKDGKEYLLRYWHPVFGI